MENQEEKRRTVEFPIPICLEEFYDMFKSLNKNSPLIEFRENKYNAKKDYIDGILSLGICESITISSYINPEVKIKNIYKNISGVKVHIYPNPNYKEMREFNLNLADKLRSHIEDYFIKQINFPESKVS